MQIPSELTAVTYQLQDTSAWTRTWTDASGGHTVVPLAVANLESSQWNGSLPTTGACDVAYSIGTAEVVLTVWNLDPATLPGQDTGGLTPGATPHLDRRYFLVEDPRAGGPGTCGSGQAYEPSQADTLANQQLSLFQQMVASVANS